jgi:hypothetical protein
MALALTLAFAFGGCSFVLVDRAPPRARWPEDNRWGLGLNRCTSSPIMPLVDSAIVVSDYALAGYAASRGGDAAPAVALLLLLPGIPYLVSALYGFSATGTCRTYLGGPPYEPQRE